MGQRGACWAEGNLLGRGAPDGAEGHLLGKGAPAGQRPSIPNSSCQLPSPEIQFLRLSVGYKSLSTGHLATESPAGEEGQGNLQDWGRGPELVVSSVGTVSCVCVCVCAYMCMYVCRHVVPWLYFCLCICCMQLSGCWCSFGMFWVGLWYVLWSGRISSDPAWTPMSVPQESHQPVALGPSRSTSLISMTTPLSCSPRRRRSARSPAWTPSTSQQPTPTSTPMSAPTSLSCPSFPPLCGGTGPSPA